MHAGQGLVRSFVKISFRRRAGKSGFAHLHRGTKSPSLLARMLSHPASKPGED